MNEVLGLLAFLALVGLLVSRIRREQDMADSIRAQVLKGKHSRTAPALQPAEADSSPVTSGSEGTLPVR